MKISPAVGAKNLEFLPKKFFTTEITFFRISGGGVQSPVAPLATPLHVCGHSSSRLFMCAKDQENTIWEPYKATTHFKR